MVSFADVYLWSSAKCTTRKEKKCFVKKILFKILLFSLIHQLWKNIFQNFAVFANPTILLEIDIR